jgi:hypothetical protein
MARICSKAAVCCAVSTRRILSIEMILLIFRETALSRKTPANVGQETLSYQTCPNFNHVDWCVNQVKLECGLTKPRDFLSHYTVQMKPGFRKGTVGFLNHIFSFWRKLQVIPGWLSPPFLDQAGNRPSSQLTGRAGKTWFYGEMVGAQGIAFPPGPDTLGHPSWASN